MPEGYSLLEMMTVVLLIMIVASISVPAYQTVRVRARGRKVSGAGLPPKGFGRRAGCQVSDLFQAGSPIDPFTGSNETWQMENEQETVGWVDPG